MGHPRFYPQEIKITLIVTPFLSTEILPRRMTGILVDILLDKK